MIVMMMMMVVMAANAEAATSVARAPCQFPLNGIPKLAQK